MSSGSNSGWVVTVDKLPQIITQLNTACAEVVEQIAKDIADVYTGTAAIDTGFMASSSYYQARGKSTYGDLVGAQDGPMLPEIEKPENDLTAHAAVAAEYAAYVEYGTRKMVAQPAFHPAIDKAKQQFEHELSDLAKRIKV